MTNGPAHPTNNPNITPAQAAATVASIKPQPGKQVAVVNVQDKPITAQEAARRIAELQADVDSLKMTAAEFSALHDNEYLHGPFRAGRDPQDVTPPPAPTRERLPGLDHLRRQAEEWSEFGPVQTRMTGEGFEVRKPAKTWKFKFNPRTWGPIFLLLVAFGLIAYPQAAKNFGGEIDPYEAAGNDGSVVFTPAGEIPQVYLDAADQLRDIQSTQMYPTGLWWRTEADRRADIDDIIERLDKNEGSTQ